MGIIILLALIVILFFIQTLLVQIKYKMQKERDARIREMVRQKIILGVNLVLFLIVISIIILVTISIDIISLLYILFLIACVLFEVPLLLFILQEYGVYYGLKEGYVLEIINDKIILPFSFDSFPPRKRKRVLIKDIDRIEINKVKYSIVNVVTIYTKNNKEYQIWNFAVPSVDELNKIIPLSKGRMKTMFRACRGRPAQERKG
jgi:hypothetical protein